MLYLAFACAVLAGICVHVGALAWAVTACLLAVAFTVVYGVEVIADAIDEAS